MQTCLDLLTDRFQVHLVIDAISSRRKLDHEAAIDRMEQAGVILTTTESALFELLERAGTPEFKQISQIFKASHTSRTPIVLITSLASSQPFLAMPTPM